MSETKPKYLETPIAEARRDYPRPGAGMTRLGYTKSSGAPSSVMIRLQGEKKWRRVMVWQFSNTGTMFVKLKGQPHIVREHDLPPIQEKTSPTAVHHMAKRSRKSKTPWVPDVQEPGSSYVGRLGRAAYERGEPRRAPGGLGPIDHNDWLAGWDLAAKADPGRAASHVSHLLRATKPKASKKKRKSWLSRIFS